LEEQQMNYGVRHLNRVCVIMLRGIIISIILLSVILPSVILLSDILPSVIWLVTFY
jgi:hypothetical protein